MYSMPVIVTALIAVANVPASANKEDVAALQGVWDEVSLKSDGKEVVKSPFAARIVISGNQLTYIIHPGEFQTTLKIDANKKPATIDAIGKEWCISGIYEVNRDTLKICYDPKTKERPKDFEAKRGTSSVLWVLKRVKKENK
jgi:uncharacterized protein (TIGR03067 family)